MDRGALLPVLPFIALLFTRLRSAAVLSASAGVAVGFWVSRVALPFDRRWWWWVLLGYAAAVSLAMAVAEALVAAVALRGRFFRGLFFALLAHTAWLAWLFLPGARGDHLFLLVVTAMVGASAATLGAARPPRA
jgi:hypothetical protein